MENFEQEEGKVLEEKEAVQEKEIDLKKATDIEIAMFWASHIDNPCGAEIAPGKKVNLRDFYLREAKEMLLGLKDDHARRFLELKIKEYE